MNFVITGVARYNFHVEAEDKAEAIRAFTKLKGDLEGTLDFRVNSIECNEVELAK